MSLPKWIREEKEWQARGGYTSTVANKVIQTLIEYIEENVETQRSANKPSAKKEPLPYA